MAYNQIRGTGQGLQFLNFPFGDTTYTKVFVGGLAWETQSEMLHGYFEQFGEILEAVVITDKHTGRSKGYGFVTFRDPESAKRACEDPNPFIDGRRANCNLASLGRPQPSFPYGHIRSPPPYFGNPQARGLPYIRSPSYHHPVPYNYQTGFSYSPYGYPPYGPEYVYQQGLYNSYMSQNGAQMYGIQGGGINANAMLYGQNMSSFVMPPPPHIIQYGQPPVETTPSIQTPQNTGNPSSSSLHQSSDSD